MFGIEKQFAPLAADARRTMAEGRQTMRVAQDYLGVLVCLVAAVLVVTAATLAAVRELSRRG